MDKRSNVYASILLIVFFIAVVVLLTAGPKSQREYLIGDSLLADLEMPNARAFPGFSIGDLQSEFDVVPDGSIVIVIAGTNDANHPVEQVRQEIAAALASLRSSCVHWFNTTNSETVNTVLLESGVTVVDWAALVQPEWFRPDGIHYNEVGQEAMRERVRDAVEDC